MRINPRIGGPNALSWPAFWVVLTASVATNLPDPYTSWALGSAWRNLLCNAIAVSVMFAVMLALRWAVLRHMGARPDPWRALAVFAVGAVVRGLMLAALLPTIGVGEARPVYRVITSLIVLIPVLAITAGVVDLVRTSAARRAAMQAEAEDLVAAEHEASTRLAGLRQGAIAEVRALLLQRLEAVRGASARAADLEAALRRDVEQVIRPMSHDLVADEVVVAPVASVPPAPRVSWGDVWRSASLGTPFRPVALASFITVASVNGLVNYNSSAARGLAYAAAQWVIVFAIFTLLGRLLTGQMRRMRVGPRSATLGFAVIGGLVMAGLLWGAVCATTGAVFAWRLPIAMMLVGPIVAFALAADQGFRRQVMVAAAEQEATNAALRVAAALAGSGRRHEERRLSRALHGPVQTAVTAAAMRIEAGDRAGAEAMLLDAMGQLDRSDAHDIAPVSKALGGVVAVWEGLCSVRTELEPGLDRDLDSRPGTASAFIDICVEACSDAVRHGGARNVTLRAHRDGNAVQLEVRDDGAPTAAESPSGLGTAMLNDVTLDWERHREGALTVMRATLPLSA